MKQTNRDILLDATQQVVGASQTKQVVSEVLRIYQPMRIIIDIACSDSTVATGITAFLQDSSDESTWNSKGSEGQVSITGDGTFSIVLLAENSSDQAELPLRPFIRVAIDSGAGDTVDIDKVVVSYEVP